MKKRKKAAPPWLVCLQGFGAALALYLVGILLLAAVMMKGLIPEEMGVPCIAGLCVLSGLVGGAVCARRTPWGTLPGAMAAAGLFAALQVAVGLCWTGVDWAGEGSVLLICSLGGGLFAGLLCSRKSRRSRKLLG